MSRDLSRRAWARGAAGLAGTVAAALALPGCAPSDARARLLVHAAASLAAPFRTLAAAFEADRPGVRVELNLAGSSDLVAQLRQGAPGDVLVTADRRTMDRMDPDALDGGTRVVARNVLVLITAPGNPRGIRGLADLDAPDTRLAACAPQVPCGAAAHAFADVQHVTLHPVTEESSVAGVVAKVTAGQVDAGLAYHSDARAAGDAVAAVELPGADRAPNEYPAAVLAESARPDDARAFVDLLLAERGRRALADAGFLLP